jgi:hypothetical protein
MLRWTPSPPRASATRPGAARVFLHCPALSFVTDGMPFSSICARFASVCYAFFFAPCNSHPICPSPRQVIREKYERLLSAAPTATLDCSSLFDGKRAIEVIERAVSKHAGRAFTPSLPFVDYCCVCTQLLSCFACGLFQANTSLQPSLRVSTHHVAMFSRRTLLQS